MFSFRTLFVMEPANSTYWPRAIILVDMNAFFASVEQRDQPALRGRPIAVTNGQKGTCIITCSYEARAFGIRTGMRLHEARQRCPDLIQCPSRPDHYADVSTRIMSALTRITPDIEVFSIDEAFLEVTRCQTLLGNPIEIGKQVKQCIWDAVQLPCSIGISGDKTTAKYAAKLNKPNGFTVIPPWEAATALATVPVTELCGIGYGIARFLAQHGVYRCKDMQHLPIGILAKRFGQVGRRIWYMCQGKDPAPVLTHAKPLQTLGHGKVLPPNTQDPNVIKIYFQHMSEKVAARLRYHALEAQTFFIGFKTRYSGWRSEKKSCAFPTDDGKIIYQLCLEVFQQHWQTEHTATQVQITALDPHAALQQQDLFYDQEVTRKKVNAVTDAINERYGELTMTPATLLQRSEMPNVISPSWRPKNKA